MSEHGKRVPGPKDPDNPDILQIKKSSMGWNYAAAFALFASGVNLRELSIAWDIPYTTLAEHARKEQWGQLVKRFGYSFSPPSYDQESAKEIEERKKKIDDNRGKIIGTADGLRGKIQKILDTMGESGDMDPETILNLARSLKLLAETSMVAHGDPYVLAAARGGKSTAPGQGGDKSPADNGPRIQIFIPPMLASPRQMKQVKATVAKAEAMLAQGDPVTDAPDEIRPEGDPLIDETPMPPVETSAIIEPESPSDAPGRTPAT